MIGTWRKRREINKHWKSVMRDLRFPAQTREATGLSYAAERVIDIICFGIIIGCLIWVGITVR